MLLLGSETSPYVRKVRIVATEKKIVLPMTLANVWADNTTASINPLGKIPVLKVDEDAIMDSRVIVQYLDSIAPTQRLIPTNNADRSKACTIEAVCDGVCDALIGVILEKRFHSPEAVSGEWVDRNMGKVRQTLDFLEARLGLADHFVSNTLTIADIACGVMLGYLDLRANELGWRDGHPALKQLFERLSTRESFVTTAPPQA